jgi:hypothetical protein
VIAGGDDVNAQLEQLFRERRSDAKSGSGIFPVGDDQINGVVAHEFWQAILDDRPSRPPEDVADEEYAHEIAVP